SARDFRVESRRMTEGTNMRLTREMFSAVNETAETKRIDDWLSFFSEDIVWEAGLELTTTYRGHEGIRGYFEDWLGTVDGIRMELRELTEVGDWTVADIRLKARIKGTDAEMVLDYSQAMLIQDGKLTHIKEFREHDDALVYAEASEQSRA